MCTVYNNVTRTYWGVDARCQIDKYSNVTVTLFNPNMGIHFQFNLYFPCIAQLNLYKNNVTGISKLKKEELMHSAYVN